MLNGQHSFLTFKVVMSDLYVIFQTFECERCCAWSAVVQGVQAPFASCMVTSQVARVVARPILVVGNKSGVFSESTKGEQNYSCLNMGPIVLNGRLSRRLVAADLPGKIHCFM